MSGKRALLALSLAVCSATLENEVQAVHAEDDVQNKQPKWDQESFTQEVLYQFLSPINAITEGNVADRVDTTPISYVVKKGDSLYKIGLSFGVSYDRIAEYNDLSDPSHLEVGKVLNIPITRKWVRINTGDTLKSLAEKYNVSEDFLVYLNPALKEVADITYVGQLIAVPHQLNPKIKDESASTNMDESTDGKKEQSKKVKRFPTVQNDSGLFLWPVEGMITSRFGHRSGRQHKGIDIWNASCSSAEICASRGGTVTGAGYSGAYGNRVVIDHGNGWVTYYAHLSRVMVRKGQEVGQGQIIGRMGQSGNATGYHLHFEIRKNDRPLNPLRMLGS